MGMFDSVIFKDVSGEEIELQFKFLDSEMKVYEIGGSPDWVCANSKEEAEKVYREFCSDKISQEETDYEIEHYPPQELSESDLDALVYQEADSSIRRTFREELERRTKPEIFAYSEY